MAVNIELSPKQWPEQIRYIPQWLQQAEASEYFKQLSQNVAWQQHAIQLFGKTIPEPRLSAWYGDIDYTYSGRIRHANQWPEIVSRLKQQVGLYVGEAFNSVLINYYRDGQDSMGWHSDNEKQLGTNPLIASVSLGDSRCFKFRHRHTREIIKIQLAHGDLLLMEHLDQSQWQHSLSKTRKACGPRINLTFRQTKTTNN